MRQPLDMNKYSYSLGLVAAMLMPLAHGGDFKHNGSARIRYEALSGQSRAGFKQDDQMISMRTILGGEYTSGAWRFGAELTDSRAYLTDARTAFSTSEVNALEPTQFYAGYESKGAFGSDSSMAGQVGRFTVNLGSRRLLAN